MNIRIVILLLLVSVSTTWSWDRKQTPLQKIEREGIEWCDMWIPAAPQTDKPRVLLIGDSITKGYYNVVSELLKEKAYCVRFATSACVADPAFHVQLQAMFSGYAYDIVHFNNGLHGVGYTEEEYQAGFEKALNTIQAEFPSAKIILALSTPLNTQSNMDHLNPRIDARNRRVRELGKRFGTTINDLHSISRNHPEFYIDPWHYNTAAIDLQGRQVAEAIEKLLSGEGG